MDYKKVELTIDPKDPWNEIMINELAEMGFESFTEEDEALQAYIPEKHFDPAKLDDLIRDFKKNELNQLNYTIETIPEQNWNEAWESDFEPVSVADQLIIYAPFHDIDSASFQYEIQIQPQMSFGTGHHQTTFLLAQVMLELDLQHKMVLDVGTGTGVLGILAAKMGAKEVFGTDIEEGAYTNAIENIKRNEVGNFSVTLGDVDVIPTQQYDIIIANINKNVLIQHLPSYADKSKTGTTLLLSGFFESDIDALENEAKKVNFRLIRTYELDSWAVMQLIKE